MTPNVWWIPVFAALIGHFGLHLAFYNRLNATGLRRLTIKLIERPVFVEMLITPPLAVYFYQQFFLDVWRGDASQLQIPGPLWVYGWVCLGGWIVLGIPWLVWRPIFGVEWADAPRTIEVVPVERELGQPLARTAICRFESRLPLNQVFDLSIESIHLPVPGLPPELDGYRIAQLSDIHLTGDIQPAYARYAVERATGWQPELMALTGDIIDKEPCIDWLPEIFSPAEAADGCFFILGNHDTRVRETWQTRRVMNRAGWTDLGSSIEQRQLRGVPALLMGSEHPWFLRPPGDLLNENDPPFRLLLSHSPDEIGWARKHEITLMLAGHTHGGQGRLPLAGPLLSPSWHGSRFASGDFYKPPTTMHVSRGLGGVHLMRIRCRPELSLITLCHVGG